MLIKALEWQTFCGRSGNCKAVTVFGTYVIQNEGDELLLPWTLYLMHEDKPNSTYPTLAAAKVGALKDWEKRTRSVVAMTSNVERENVRLRDINTALLSYAQRCNGKMRKAYRKLDELRAQHGVKEVDE